MMRLWTPAVLCCLALSGPARAQNHGLDVIREDSAFGLLVKNLNDLRDKGDKLHKELDLKDASLPRPTDLFRDLFKLLIGSEKGIDGKGPAALIVPSPEQLKIKPSGNSGIDAINLITNLVVVVPLSDADDMAANFGFKKGDWKLGEVKSVKSAEAFIFSKLDYKLLLTEKFAYAAINENAIKVLRASKSKPLSAVLTRRQAQAVKESDGILHIDVRELGTLWKEVVDDFVKKLEGAEDKAVLGSLTAALLEAKNVTLAMKVQNGLKFDFVTSFSKTDGEAAKFLNIVRAGPGRADLNGLPTANPLMAYAAKGDGEKNVHQARALLKVLLKGWLGIDVEISKEDRKRFEDAFDVLYSHLKGSRSALYAVDPKRAEKVGDMAMVVILDLDDPSEHLAGWKGVVEVANKAAPKITKEDRTSTPKFAFKPKAGKLDDADVDVLSVEVPGMPKEVRDGYLKQLGPDWNKLKMVTVGKQIVALFGSDTDLLREAIRNVKEGKKGLAGNKAFAAHLATLPAERKIEVHQAVGPYTSLLDGKRVEPKAWSAIAFVIEPDRLEIKLVLSPADLRVMFGVR
jgi:hypothetical protein